jgi:alcohol dehydrogenase
MKAAVFEEFGKPLSIQNVADPTPDETGVVIEVKANGVCRSDWHGWMGHDPDIQLPHVPGHELAGVIAAVGKNVLQWQEGDRVTLPFVCGCGTCLQCLSGNQQVCDHQFQPGFTHWGSFAQFVGIHYADDNLVRLPDEIDFVTAASLGCRFVTSFRGIVDQGKVSAGQWVAVHGCGGVGLSAVMIAHAAGAQVVAVDIDDAKLDFAHSLGAAVTINSKKVEDVVAAVKDVSGGGAHVSMDALGHPETCFNSISNLRKHGKHIQVGLMLADQRRPQIPMDKVVANELEILGSHGIQAHRYGAILEMIHAGLLDPSKLIDRRVTLEEGIQELITMEQFKGIGIAVIDQFN